LHFCLFATLSVLGTSLTQDRTGQGRAGQDRTGEFRILFIVKLNQRIDTK
jgi:hypothetical protein